MLNIDRPRQIDNYRHSGSKNDNSCMHMLLKETFTMQAMYCVIIVILRTGGQYIALGYQGMLYINTVDPHLSGHLFLRADHRITEFPDK